MSTWRSPMGLISVLSGLLFFNAASSFAPLVPADEAGPARMAESMLAQLPDGAYQFCTEPDPQDWRDGAGVCLTVVKQGTAVDGYYGYPHSDSFVCLQGQISEENWFDGRGLVVSWAGQTWSDIPEDEFLWDQEGLLSLSQVELIHRDGMGEEQVDWIVFHQARLNMQGLYHYSSPRMTSPTQLCDWPFQELRTSRVTPVFLDDFSRAEPAKNRPTA